MCDYCDCRTRPLLAQLGADHEQIVVMASRLRAAVDPDDRMRLARQLREALDLHSRREEAALYPELARAGVPTDALHAEHAEVDATLASAAGERDVVDVDVRKVLDELDEHIHREEYDLFPAAHQILDDAAWDRIDAAATTVG